MVVAPGHRPFVNTREVRRLPNLSGRRALVTGAEGILGRAIAASLTTAGAAVVLVGNDSKKLADVVTDIVQSGGAASALVRDLADLNSLGSIAWEVMSGLGAIDILVNVQGQTFPGDGDNRTDASVVEAALRANVIAPVVLSAALAHDMSARGWGRIVNVCIGDEANNPTGCQAEHPGGHATGSSAVRTASALSVAAIEAHTYDLASELLSSGVTVNLYRPGTVDPERHCDAHGSDCPTATHGRAHKHQCRSSARGCPACSARWLVSQLDRDDTGSAWAFPDDRDDPPVRAEVTNKAPHDKPPTRGAIKWFPAGLPEWLSR